MKKVLFVMAVAGMFGFAACNSNKPAEEAVETPAVEEVMPAETTAPVEEAAAVEGAATECTAAAAETASTEAAAE
ncbi:MAG: hypothetical protein IJU19_02885 [Bacteroidales bacterium]|nr:hypothetical protein [Bacteroidales bacterium]